MLIENKSVVIYGAGGAIGGAVAFAREGEKVFLPGRTLDSLNKVGDRILAAGGMSAVEAFDAFDELAVEQHAAAVVAKASGMEITFKAIDIEGSTQGTPEVICQPVANRLEAYFLTARATARHMIQKRAGVILIITGTPARMAFPLAGSFGIEGAEAMMKMDKINIAEVERAANGTEATQPEFLR